MLKVMKLVKHYKKTDAVNGIDFEIQQGEVMGILGPNGAGKTTTIKCIAGLIRATEGEITVNGQVNTSLMAKRLMAYIPEVPEAYELMTVWEHMVFIAKAYRLKDWEPKAESLLNRFEMSDKKDKLAKELSKGMKQKLSICMGLVTEPKVVLFDEPMIGLDPKAIKETKAVMRELAKDGCAVLVSTHLLDTIESTCDKVLVLKDGHVVAAGTPDELRSKMGTSEASLEELFLEVTKDA
ncbi:MULTISPECIES: ABC transporter ATP-binding protein [unclassified Fusibacter]|uniref:ABC transporter ATP-binding protein n=1 Tax=unclassified Fusibacter TaxID=2624464 RepID=UPI0010122179|nr:MULTISPECIES: ABC transporter ATP-binding protein [unclassified Fusibacter]MCK8061640.1 ABC transporter ATP-binding protein [Fusibacter sp. A2]NPE23824.1 ABC transporter ATP-binding protein [Fusibacter sp. A1]RXV58597.1 ABC transporter ATP-binding protein [Fusibacter sp. A1]